MSQLSGGIHAYQEAFPDGDGYFRGKNFVYDRRIAVPCRNLPEVIGECRLCGGSCDDYKPQVRCGCCRMLQLVCEQCRSSRNSSGTSSGSSGEEEGGMKEQEQEQGEVAVICALCEDKGRGGGGVAVGRSS